MTFQTPVPDSLPRLLPFRKPFTLSFRSLNLLRTVKLEKGLYECPRYFYEYRGPDGYRSEPDQSDDSSSGGRRSPGRIREVTVVRVVGDQRGGR